VSWQALAINFCFTSKRPRHKESVACEKGKLGVCGWYLHRILYYTALFGLSIHASAAARCLIIFPGPYVCWEFDCCLHTLAIGGVRACTNSILWGAWCALWVASGLWTSWTSLCYGYRGLVMMYHKANHACSRYVCGMSCDIAGATCLGPT